MLIFACRRRRHARASSRVVAPSFSGTGGRSQQAFPSWQEAQQTSYGPGATDMRWYYPTQPAAPSYQAKNTVYAPQSQRSAQSERVPSAAPFGEVQRTPPSDQVQGSAPPTSQAQSTPFSGQVQGTVPPGEAQRTVPTSQVQRISPPAQEQRTSPTRRVRRVPPPVLEQNTVPLGRMEEQGVPSPPLYAYTGDTPSAGATNGRDQSPPPYYPVSRPLFSCVSRLTTCPHNRIV